MTDCGMPATPTLHEMTLIFELIEMTPTLLTLQEIMRTIQNRWPLVNRKMREATP